MPAARAPSIAPRKRGRYPEPSSAMATTSRWTSITRSALFAMLAVPSPLGNTSKSGGSTEQRWRIRRSSSPGGPGSNHSPGAAEQRHSQRELAGSGGPAHDCSDHVRRSHPHRCARMSCCWDPGQESGRPGVTASTSDPLRYADVESTLPHRTALLVRSWAIKRRWSIRGEEWFQGMPLIECDPEDLAQVATVARAWHDGVWRVAGPAHGGERTGAARVCLSCAGRGGIWRAGAAGALPVHQPLGAPLLDHYPPGPVHRRAVPARA